jgi:hypothetical protein
MLTLLQENANVYVNGDLDGGKKKKKKKVFTTKKKNKHIHKRVKLSTYNLYSVDGILSIIKEKEMLLNKEKPALHVAQELLWLNIGIDIIADSVILPLRWMLRQLKRMKKL